LTDTEAVKKFPAIGSYHEPA